MVEEIIAEFFLNLMKNVFTYPRSSQLSNINPRKTPCRHSIVRVENQRQRKNFGNNQGGNTLYSEGYNFQNVGCLLIRNDGGQKAIKLEM